MVILPDNDETGQQRAMIRGAGMISKAKSVRILDIADHWLEAPSKADITDWKEATNGTAETFKALATKARPWKPERPKSRFGALEWSRLDEKGPELEFLVDGWLTEGERSVIGGPSRSGKSFLSIHLSMCVARGQDFFDNPVKKGGVIYQAGEGAKAPDTSPTSLGRACGDCRASRNPRNMTIRDIGVPGGSLAPIPTPARTRR